jgi:hypothetical protein
MSQLCALYGSIRDERFNDAAAEFEMMDWPRDEIESHIVCPLPPHITIKVLPDL